MARSEAQIASASHRPTSAGSATSTSIHSLGDVVPKLEEAIEEAQSKFPDDAFAAKVCLAEILWLRGEVDRALGMLRRREAQTRTDATGALGWSEVCEVKSAFISAACLESKGDDVSVRRLYLKTASTTPGSRTPELRAWTERVLATACRFMFDRTSEPTLQTLRDALICFNTWSDFWQRCPAWAASASVSQVDIPRREIWKAYYELLSILLQRGLVLDAATQSLRYTHTLDSHEQSEAKSRQRAALQRVEATYESLLLDETQFPKASQTNLEVEQWAQLVVSNWRIFDGRGWTSSELGEGGEQRVGRRVLDILYRAATKTFHSTAILRYLFTVHGALGDFELAMHSFDSYVEIMAKGKARAEKTGNRESALDDEDSAVQTAADAVRMLCRYGGREEAEKALKVVKTIERWMKLDGDNSAAPKPLQPRTLAAAYRAIGTSKAHWSKLTYELEARSSLRTEAVSSLRLSSQHDLYSLETAHALASVLAESRDVPAAVQVIRNAVKLAEAQNMDNSDEESAAQLRAKRDFVPLWHLLALCMTAKDDYEQAASICEFAFDQCGESFSLSGESTRQSRSAIEKPAIGSMRALLGSMEGVEKARFIEIKTTKLALIELMDGAEVAVDFSHELLALYSKLFGNPESLQTHMRPPRTAVSTTPSKKAGTLRSLAGSIRPRSARTSHEQNTQGLEMMSALNEKELPAPGNTRNNANGATTAVPIAITVTSEDGVSSDKKHEHHHHFPFKLRGQQGDWREHGNLGTSRSKESLHEKQLPQLPKADMIPTDKNEKNNQESASVLPAVTSSMSGNQSAGPQQPLGKIAHNSSHDTQPPPPGHQDQPPEQDVRLPVLHPALGFSPEVRLSSAHDKQFRLSILVDIWLFIAGLYQRADLHDNASGAISEALKHVELYQADMAAEGANARQMYEKGWGAGKSLDELWADVWAAVSASNTLHALYPL